MTELKTFVSNWDIHMQ